MVVVAYGHRVIYQTALPLRAPRRPHPGQRNPPRCALTVVGQISVGAADLIAQQELGARCSVVDLLLLRQDLYSPEQLLHLSADFEE